MGTGALIFRVVPLALKVEDGSDYRRHYRAGSETRGEISSTMFNYPII